MNINTINYLTISLSKNATIDDIKTIKRYFLNHYWFENVLFKIDHFNHNLLVHYETNQRSHHFDSLKPIYEEFNHLIESMKLDLKNEYFGIIGYGLINKNTNEIHINDLHWVDLKESTIHRLFPILKSFLEKYNEKLDYLYLKLFSWLNFINAHGFLTRLRLEYYSYENLEWIINKDFIQYLLKYDYHDLDELEIKSLDGFINALIDQM